MTFMADERVIAYRRAVNENVQGAERLAIETGFAAYMVQHTDPVLRNVTLRVLAREGIARQALADAAGLTAAELEDLPLPDTSTGDPVSALRALPYAEYLKTDHWHFTRRLAIQRAGGRCCVCNDHDGRLEVHHNTYENRGEERPEDLVVLCDACHTLYHEHGKLAA